MKEVIVHVGLHKTATSTIQSTLARNADCMLSKTGYKYPVFNLDGRTIENHSIPIYSLFSESPSTYHINVRWDVDVQEVNKEYRRQLDECLERHEKLIFSGEDISILSERSLAKFRDYLSNFGFRVRVISFVRRPYSFLCSMLQQNIKGGQESLSKISVPKASLLIRNLKGIFPEIEFYSFERACQSSFGPVGFFLELIAAEQATYINTVNANEGLGDETVRLINYINSQYPSIVDGKLNPLRDDIHHFNSELDFDDRKFLLSDDELQAVRAELEEENNALRDMLGDECCDKDFPTNTGGGFNHEMLTCLVRQSQQLPFHIRLCIYDYLRNRGVHAIDCFKGLLMGGQEMEFDAVTLRDTALYWEGRDIEVAYKFMCMAKKLRPHGELISKKVEVYKEALELE
ncbi:hypothetical protein [Microbulbifer zhoushanensis]|uniref:hypothetical protein n=1 Tax=Microbulbifer zhoushanensis TaxID=2904254 RepID=UPI001F1970DD|nr:hypothetical protein [Microbulbifer zhoushanensis]